MQEEPSIAALCDTLAVSRNGYHAWATRAPGSRAQADAVLWPLIEQAYAESCQTYGSPRIRQWLGPAWTKVLAPSRGAADARPADGQPDQTALPSGADRQPPRPAHRAQ